MQSRKEEIRSCAARLFRKKGYKATSVRDIAQAVGVKPASLYNHINSKEELLNELLLRVANLFTNGMNKINQASISIEEKLERLIALHIHLTTEHTDAVSLITGEWVHLNEPVRSEYIRLKDEYEKGFREIIELGKKEGLYKDIDTEIILFSILSTLRWLYSWYSKNKQHNAIDLERQMIICLIEGIKK